MKLSHWAKLQGITYKTAWGMFSRKQIPNARQLPTGTIIVDDDLVIDGGKDRVEKMMAEMIELLKEIKNRLE
jgi:hypothetical protein